MRVDTTSMYSACELFQNLLSRSCNKPCFTPTKREIFHFYLRLLRILTVLEILPQALVHKRKEREREKQKKKTYQETKKQKNLFPSETHVDIRS